MIAVATPVEISRKNIKEVMTGLIKHDLINPNNLLIKSVARKELDVHYSM